jgi:hypothetical protein
MFTPFSGWMIPVNTLVEWPKTEIQGRAKCLLCCSFIFTYLSQLNPENNVLSNLKGFLLAVQRPFKLKEY